MLVRRPIVRIFHERKFLRPPIRLVGKVFAADRGVFACKGGARIRRR